MKAGLAALIGSAWKPSALEPGYPVLAAPNYGELGSRARHTQRGSVGLRNVRYPHDPRLRAFNTLTPLVWRNRDANLAVAAAMANRARPLITRPVTFTPPATASLMFKRPPQIGPDQ